MIINSNNTNTNTTSARRRASRASSPAAVAAAALFLLACIAPAPCDAQSVVQQVRRAFSSAGGRTLTQDAPDARTFKRPSYRDKDKYKPKPTPNKCLGNVKCKEDTTCEKKFPCFNSFCDFGDGHGGKDSWKRTNWKYKPDKPRHGVCACEDEKKNNHECIVPGGGAECTGPLGKCSYEGQCVPDDRDDGCPCDGNVADASACGLMLESLTPCNDPTQPCKCDGDGKCVPNFLDGVICPLPASAAGDAQCKVYTCQSDGSCDPGTDPVPDATPCVGTIASDMVTCGTGPAVSTACVHADNPCLCEGGDCKPNFLDEGCPCDVIPGGCFDLQNPCLDPTRPCLCASDGTCDKKNFLDGVICPIPPGHSDAKGDTACKVYRCNALGSCERENTEDIADGTMCQPIFMDDNDVRCGAAGIKVSKLCVDADIPCLCDGGLCKPNFLDEGCPCKDSLGKPSTSCTADLDDPCVDPTRPCLCAADGTCTIINFIEGLPCDPKDTPLDKCTSDTMGTCDSVGMCVAASNEVCTPVDYDPDAFGLVMCKETGASVPRDCLDRTTPCICDGTECKPNFISVGAACIPSDLAGNSPQCLDPDRPGMCTASGTDLVVCVPNPKVNAPCRLDANFAETVCDNLGVIGNCDQTGPSDPVTCVPCDTQCLGVDDECVLNDKAEGVCCNLLGELVCVEGDTCPVDDRCETECNQESCIGKCGKAATKQNECICCKTPGSPPKCLLEDTCESETGRPCCALDPTQCHGFTYGVCGGCGSGNDNNDMNVCPLACDACTDYPHENECKIASESYCLPPTNSACCRASSTCQPGTPSLCKGTGSCCICNNDQGAPPDTSCVCSFPPTVIARSFLQAIAEMPRESTRGAAPTEKTAARPTPDDDGSMTTETARARTSASGDVQVAQRPAAATARAASSAGVYDASTQQQQRPKPREP